MHLHLLVSDLPIFKAIMAHHDQYRLENEGATAGVCDEEDGEDLIWLVHCSWAKNKYCCTKY